MRSPWPTPYLCINPTYPLPEEEFFAHLYLYVRDREDIVRHVAAPSRGIRLLDARSSAGPARARAPYQWEPLWPPVVQERREARCRVEGE